MTSTILGIDPGTEQSALVVWGGERRVLYHSMLPNEEAIAALKNLQIIHGINQIVIESISSYGMPVGKEVFQTCYWIGRFWQKAIHLEISFDFVARRDIKLHHCGSARAKDSNIRQVLLDKYGPQGTKKEPGVTYGLSKHLWSAFAIATWYTETKQPIPY